MEEYLDAGRIVSTHGVKGEAKVVPLCDSAEFLRAFRTLYLDGKPLTVESFRIHKDAALIKFVGFDSVESVMALRGKVLQFARTDARLSPGQVFLADILGLPVYDTRRAQEIGALADVLFLPAGEVWVVKGPLGECMIPGNGGFIEPADPAEGRIVVHTIEGMLPDEN